MIPLPDVNVLLAWSWPNHAFNDAARAFGAGLGEWASCPSTESAFVRLSMNPKVVAYPATFDQALELLRRMTSHEAHRFWVDDARLLDEIPRQVVQGHRQVPDAALVALAAKHDGQVVTFDRRLQSLLRRSDRHLVRVLPT